MHKERRKMRNFQRGNHHVTSEDGGGKPSNNYKPISHVVREEETKPLKRATTTNIVNNEMPLEDQRKNKFLR